MSLFHFLAGIAITLAVALSLAVVGYYFITKVLGIEGFDIDITPVYGPKDERGGR